MKFTNLVGSALILPLICLIILTACSRKSEIPAILTRFEQDLFSKDTLLTDRDLSLLKDKHAGFLPLFTEHVIGIGKLEDPNIHIYLNQFINDPVIRDVFTETQKVFPDFSDQGQVISQALENFHDLVDLPGEVQINTFVSGFNQSFVTLPSHLSIGIDNYLGKDCLFYRQLRLPAYIIEKMNPEQVVADAVVAWISSEMTPQESDPTLLDKMIHEGLIMYTAVSVLPKKEKLNVMKYSKDQWDWCLENEKAIWQYMVENELLFSTDMMLIRRLTGEAPFTREFGSDSPPRVGSWMGYRIVERMMSRTKSPLKDIFLSPNPKNILALSAYRP